MLVSTVAEQEPDRREGAVTDSDFGVGHPSTLLAYGRVYLHNCRSNCVYMVRPSHLSDV